MEFEIIEVKDLPYEPQTHELPPCDCRFAVRLAKGKPNTPYRKRKKREKKGKK